MSRPVLLSRLQERAGVRAGLRNMPSSPSAPRIEPGASSFSRTREKEYQCSCGVGFGLFAGCTLLSIVIGEPLLSLTCPLVTTSSPSLRPFTIAT